jgi:hypothetical protein
MLGRKFENPHNTIEKPEPGFEILHKIGPKFLNASIGIVSISLRPGL